MVKEVRMPQLATFEQKPYFWTEGASTGVFFRAPVNGKTTPNSKYPRTELRQMYSNGDPAAWSNKSETWSMEARMAFTRLPSGKPHLVGMQVHDGSDDVTVLRLEGNDLWATNGDNPHYDLLNGNYVLGTFMLVKIEARKGGGFRWYINGTPVATIPGVKKGCYFKVGAYVQDNEGPSSEVGEVCFKSLRVWKS